MTSAGFEIKGVCSLTPSRREVSVSGTFHDIKTTCSARKTSGVTHEIEMLLEFLQRDQAEVPPRGPAEGFAEGEGSFLAGRDGKSSG